MDSEQTTQFWIEISTTLATSASAQPSIKRELYSRITKGNRERNPNAAARAQKILEAASTTAQDTTPSTSYNVQPEHTQPHTNPNSSTKQAKPGKTEASSTKQNITEHA